MRLIPTGGSTQQTEVKGPFELWKDQGHPNGTVEEFLESLKAEKEAILYLQDTPPVNPPKTPCLWLQTGMGPNGTGITLNLIRRKP